jgi:predicted dinucleotide-binding enzyme
MATVAVLGSGDVGKVLALGFTKHGHTARIGSREGNKLGAWSAEHGIPEGTFASVLEGADIAVLAVAGGAAEGLVDFARVWHGTCPAALPTPPDQFS